ncbi:DMT family transporter [Candidatus Hepatincolaceae symbiont of Richtersius coronifer]
MLISDNNNRKGFLLGFAGFFALSVTDTTNRFTLSNDLIAFPTYFACVQIMILILLAAFGTLRYKSTFFKVNDKKMVFCRSFILSLNILCGMLAVSYLSLDLFYSIVFTMPLLATVLGAIFLKEKIRPLQIISLVLGLIGILIIIQPSISAGDRLLGLILALLTAFTGVSAALITRKYLQKENSLTSTFYAFLLSAILGIGMFFTLSPGFALLSPNPSSLLLIILSSIATLIGATLYMKAYQVGKVSYVAPSQYTQLIWGICFGYLLFSDSVAAKTLIGAAIIIFACLLNLYKNKS